MYHLAGSQEHVGLREQGQLQKQYLKVLEENNLLRYEVMLQFCMQAYSSVCVCVCRYKLELLLDMLAASNADCLVLQRELNALKKAPPQSPTHITL